MKVTVPSRTVEACDICHRQLGGGLLTKCIVCGKEYCHTCEAIICGCVHRPDLCKKCAEHESVREVVGNFSKPLSDVLKLREKSLSKLRLKVIPKP